MNEIAAILKKIPFSIIGKALEICRKTLDSIFIYLEYPRVLNIYYINTRLKCVIIMFATLYSTIYISMRILSKYSQHPLAVKCYLFMYKRIYSGA